MRFAILGGGFAGLAVTWFILHYTQGSATVDLYDPEPIGGGASGLSSGLLHPYTGKQARPAWEAARCLKETHRLITVASQAIARPIVISKGILRPALSEQQVADFQKCATSFSDTEWWDKELCEKKVTGLKLPPEGGGLYIKDGITLDSKEYLQGLWQACALLGTQYRQQSVIQQADLIHYDKILIAMGPLSKNLPPLKNLPITPVKGQTLVLKWPEGVKPLPFSLISQKYIVMSPDQKSCLAGSTFEHTFSTPKADREKAIAEIMPNISTYFPPLAGAEIIECKAAFRASTPSHLPLAGKISDKIFFFTGLGSKGLLYHAWLGKLVARTLISGDPTHLPKEIYYPLT